MQAMYQMLLEDLTKFTHLILTINPTRRNVGYPHFTVEETETQRSKTTFLRLPS